MFLKILFPIIGSLGMLGSIAAKADDYRFSTSAATIRPLEQVNAKIWRSGRPTMDSLKQAYANGVRIIIDLEDNQNAVALESTAAQQIGFKFYSFPMSAMTGPTDAQVNQILAMLKNAPAATLVHCHHGEDRSGLIIGLERVFIEGWTAQAAYTEMLNKGFHRQLVALDQYFRSKTHL